MLSVKAKAKLVTLVLTRHDGTTVSTVSVRTSTYLRTRRGTRSSLFTKQVGIFRSSLISFTRTDARLCSLVMSGPPCFISSLGYPGLRQGATHRASALALRSLLRCDHGLLAPRKHVTLVLPCSRGSHLASYVRARGLFLSGRISIVPMPSTRPGQLLTRLASRPPTSPTFSSQLAVRVTERQCASRCVGLAGSFCLGVWKDFLSGGQIASPGEFYASSMGRAISKIGAFGSLKEARVSVQLSTVVNSPSEYVAPKF